MAITPIPENTIFEDVIPAINAQLDILAGGVAGVGAQTVPELRAEILALLAATKVYDQAGTAWGKPAAGGRVFFIPVVRPCDFPVDCTRSRARAAIAPTADAVFTIKRNGTTIGTLTFAAGVLVGVFAMAVTQNFVAGDYLEIFAPASQDATLEDAGWNLLINFT